jgi:hypothetical protein
MESNYAAHRAKIGCQSSQPDSAGGLPACPELIRQASSLKAESAKLANIHFHTIFLAKIFRARSTTISEVTCFMQA